ncbi:MAG: dihydrofolate reductase [Ignavibacteriaceae bacterium]
MKNLKIILTFLVLILIIGCNKQKEEKVEMPKNEKFKYQTEQFADLAILRYQVPGFEELSLKQKELLYYLSQAALSGRDIFYDQNYKHNLKIRRTLEAIVNSYNGDKNSDEFKKFMVYTKRVWFSNGIHHHYSTMKIIPEFSKDYFAQLVKSADTNLLPLSKDETPDKLIETLTPIMFDPKIDAKRVNLNSKDDLIKTSANNYYGENITEKEVEEFYKKAENKNDSTPIWYGLNSKLVKENGKLVEKVWKVGGMYSPAIEKIVYWLQKADSIAENKNQKNIISKLIEFYKTGNLKIWDDYNIIWASDTTSVIDAVNGFIEVYSDPLGHKGSYESLISFKDKNATKRIGAISDQAQWFEDNSTIAPEFKKKNVVGISAKVITIVMLSGDASPYPPIGINLPNSTWIRKEYGSKSVNLGNIVEGYNNAASENEKKEFYYTDEDIELANKYGNLADDLHTDMHEAIGHASGQINPGVGTPKQTLKNYASTIEEARADLVALYYLPDQKLVDIGVSPTTDIAKAEYNKYILNGLVLQLKRIELGDDIEESHMRNRQLIAKWAYEKGKPENVIEKKIKDGKTYFVINDYKKLRELFGQLLKEMQRITSEGDFQAAKNIVETYGVKVDQKLHKEIKERYSKLDVAPYKGFMNPRYEPVMKDGKITDIKISYPEDFTEEMLYYSKNYSFLPNEN